ncbi:MAG: dihydropyrimidinase [FCB group bacterium]|nr:dihydropyrimidinase [FCB group bacterium]
MQYDIIIKNGVLVTSTGRYEADIAVKGEKIAVVGQNIEGDAKRIIDASGMYIFPGAIDVHVHLQLPFCGTVSADDFENGSKAAACGGVTTIIDFAMQKKGKTLLDAVEKRREEADDKVCIDYSLHAVPTDWSSKVRDEMGRVMEYGVSSFKMFMVYRSEGLISEDDALFSALEESSEIGALIGVHAESATILDYLTARYHTQDMMKKYGAYCHALSRPNYIEAEAVSRAITWAEAAGGNLYIVHMSTKEGAELVKDARSRDVKVFAETCPHYLLLEDELFKSNEGHLYATCPQLKKQDDMIRLWKGLEGGELSIVSTDTCTFTREQKNKWNGDFTKIPFGMPGVETIVPLIYTQGVQTGRLTMERMCALVSENPARLMGMYPQKGSLLPGTDADIMIIDPDSRQIIDYEKLQTNCDWSPFQGWETVGMPRYTILRGEIVAENGKFKGKTGAGKFVKRGKPDLINFCNDY